MMQEARNTLTVIASNSDEQGFGRGLVSIVIGDRFGNLGMIRVTERGIRRHGEARPRHQCPGTCDWSGDGAMSNAKVILGHPGTPADSMTEAEWRELWTSIRKTFREWTASFPDELLPKKLRGLIP